EYESQLRAQFGDGRAKEFILGKAVERGNDFLVVVRARRGALGLQHFAQLRTQNRNVLRFLGVGLGGEQPDKIVERDDATRGVGAANRDAVHWAAAMHVRFAASLADHQRRPFEEKLAACGWEFSEQDGGAKSRLVVLAHDAEFRARIKLEFRGTVAAAHEKAAIAEKYKAAVDEPAQEIADFDQFAVRRGFFANLQGQSGHPFEIAGRRADLGENGDNIALDFARLFGRGLQLEFRVNERFAALSREGPFERGDPALLVASDSEDRVKHRANGGAKMMEIFEQAVDDKRAVGGHDLDDGERVVVVTRNRFDSRDHGLGADGKEFECRLHER